MMAKVLSANPILIFPILESPVLKRGVAKRGSQKVLELAPIPNFRSISMLGGVWELAIMKILLKFGNGAN